MSGADPGEIGGYSLSLKSIGGDEATPILLLHSPPTISFDCNLLAAFTLHFV